MTDVCKYHLKRINIILYLIFVCQNHGVTAALVCTLQTGFRSYTGGGISGVAYVITINEHLQ